MTVEELREKLAHLPGDMIVIVQKDSEGNDYSPLAGVDGGNTGYTAESTWSGEVKYLTLTEELKRRGFSEEDCRPEATPCVVLFPVN